MLGLVLFAKRRRIWPDVKVRVRPGGHQQQRAAVPSVDADGGVPFGTIVETIWGCDRRGRRQPVKVEYLAGVADTSRPTDIVEVALGTAGGGGTRSKTHVWSAHNSKLDVLVTAGATLKRGTYMAAGKHGNVKVRVR